MRASERERIGAAGESAVTEAFERLGWGVAANSRHDLGTDLFVFARDQRHFDLGLAAGAQVKTGTSWFRNPNKDKDGRALGWWYRDKDREHVDAWVRHGLPHLLVLHDLDARTSYWVHVTAETVISTGKGAKIFVPAAQTLTQEHRDALVAVAATPRLQVAWEGSAWTGAASLVPADLLRHALLVPRVIAPHPNAGHGMALTFPQAVALLVQGRVRDLAAFAEKHPDVPTLTEAGQSSHWGWRFVGALGHRLDTDEADVLLEVIESAPDVASRVAAVVAAAAALVENDHVDQAVDLLRDELQRDQAGPVDHAWLTVQHARACEQIGRTDQARAGAADVQRVRITHPDDVTATAIAGVAAAMLWDLSDWGSKAVEQGGLDRALTGVDTAAAWWRAQTLSRGLQAVTKRTYNAWAQDTTVTWSASDVANNELFGASLSANHLGDHAGWRHAFTLMGKDALLRLDRHADPQHAQAGLGTLRLAGDTQALTLAVKRLTTDGPATAVTAAAAEVDLAAATRTSAPAALALLRHGGDVLEEQVADRCLTWLLATMDDQAAFIAKTTPSYWVDLELVKTLAGVVPAASAHGQDAVLKHLAALPGQQDELLARSWGHVVHALPEGAWSESTLFWISAGAQVHHDELRLPLLGLAAHADPGVRTELAEQVRAGSLDALHAYGSVQTLPTEIARAAVERTAEHIAQRIDDASRGIFRGYGVDIGHALTVLNAWHPDLAAWEALMNLLQHPLVPGRDKRGALQVLSALVERIPADIQDRLTQIATALIDQPSPARDLPLFEPAQVTGPATELLAALGTSEPEHSSDHMLRLLSGGLEDRKSAARAAARRGNSEDEGVLVVLAQDLEPQVRASAGAGLALLAGVGRGGALAAAGLRRCAHDPGTLVPTAVVSTLVDLPERTSIAEEILLSLHEHSSARVRTTASSA